MPDLEPPYCGICLSALDDRDCPRCNVGWDHTLELPEARAFRAGLLRGLLAGESPFECAWLAVAKWREHGRPEVTDPAGGKSA